MRALLVLLWVGASSFAQLPPADWWRDPQWQQRLKLKAGQVERIDALFKGRRDEFIDLHAEVEKLEGVFSDTFDQDPFDKSKATRAADALEEARRRASRALVQFQIEIRAVLTLAQFRALRPELGRMRSPAHRKPAPPSVPPPVPRPPASPPPGTYAWP